MTACMHTCESSLAAAVAAAAAGKYKAAFCHGAAMLVVRDSEGCRALLTMVMLGSSRSYEYGRGHRTGEVMTAQ